MLKLNRLFGVLLLLDVLPQGFGDTDVLLAVALHLGRPLGPIGVLVEETLQDFEAVAPSLQAVRPDQRRRELLPAVPASEVLVLKVRPNQTGADEGVADLPL